MSDIAIKAENVGKLYRLGQIGTGTLSHDLNRWWAQVRGKEDPFAKIGEANDRTKKGESDYVWALQDVDFEIKKGDAVGIIGRNGAGKSTLLKLLSKVTKPTTGSIKIDGRIASLLEVGTGFHPEMTGRENIYLNGAILGMRKREIDRKFDEIVDFSGVERYIDTPVKRYSSGMYVRLAFAVAAHLESEILIVDEVLAVGDAEFQKKCLGKMGDVSKSEGRTVLFVSHNMAAVKELCSSGILMDNGTIKYSGDSASVISRYISVNDNIVERTFTENNRTQIRSIRLLNKSNLLTNSFSYYEDIFVEVQLSVEDSNMTFSINCKESGFRKIFAEEKAVETGVYSFKIPAETLLKGDYVLDFYLYQRNISIFDEVVDSITVKIIDLPKEYLIYDGADCGVFKSPIKWIQ